MENLDDWIGIAAKYNGIAVAWINQAGAPALKKGNVSGVCRAITLDWIAAYSAGTAEQVTFLSAFRILGSDKQLLNVNVPEKYIKPQAAYQKQLEIDRVTYQRLREDQDLKFKVAETLNTQLQLKKKQGLTPDPSEDAALTNALKISGAAMNKVNEFAALIGGGPRCANQTNFNSFAEVIAALENAQPDSHQTTPNSEFVAMGLTGPGSSASNDRFGHIVGLEFGWNRKPPLFEFLDANTGLFCFPTQKDMIDFVRRVWSEFYESYWDKGAIDKLKLYSYPGGTAVEADPKELLDLIAQKAALDKDKSCLIQ